VLETLLVIWVSNYLLLTYFSTLGLSGFVHAAAYLMAENTENMKLAELRQYLNEEYDFSAEIKAKIEACPEFSVSLTF
jgi:hypothetical protein